MHGTRPRPRGRWMMALLCAACFLAASVICASRTAAATWEMWPRKPAGTDAGQEPAPPPSPPLEQKEAPEGWKVRPLQGAGTDGAPAMDLTPSAEPGEAADRKTNAGFSRSTIGWILLGVAAAVGIGLAAGGGGSDGGGNVVVNPGHQ